MPVKQSHYEELLADYSNCEQAIALLKQYRPYMEMIPSIRRPSESAIAIPLPTVRLREAVSSVSPSGLSAAAGETICLPCDVAILMCDPDWKIKVGVEIFIYIHRPQEEFSDLLRRWRQTQVWLSHGYEWLMPLRYQYILGEAAESIYPLFVVFGETPERIKRGLKGAALPFVCKTLSSPVETEPKEPEEPSEEIFSGQE